MYMSTSKTPGWIWDQQNITRSYMDSFFVANTNTWFFQWLFPQLFSGQIPVAAIQSCIYYAEG